MTRLFRWIALFVLLVLIGGGAFLIFFFTRFNPNNYRSYLASSISNALGLDAQLGALSLGWNKNGLGIEVDDIRLAREKGMVPFLAADSFFLRFNPFDLMSGKLVLSEFNLMGTDALFLKRSDGSINWVTQLPKQQTQPTIAKGMGRFAGGLALLFSRARLSEGNFTYRDETRAPVLEIPIKNIQAELEYKLTAGIIKMRGEGRVLSQTENDLEWDGEWHIGDQELDSKIQFRQKEISLESKILPLQNPPRFQGTLKLDQFVQNEGPLTGTYNGEVGGEGAGRNPEEVKRLLTGRGALEIQNGAFRDVNLIRNLLARITVIPGLQEVLVGAVPPPFQSLFNSPDTPFELLQIGFQIQGGQATLSSFVLKGEHFLVQADGTIGIEQGDFNLRAKLIFLEEISQFLIDRVNELSYLKNEQERIVIPFVYRGRGPNIYPQPDLAYLGQHLIVSQGTRLLEEGLQALARHKGEGE